MAETGCAERNLACHRGKRLRVSPGCVDSEMPVGASMSDIRRGWLCLQGEACGRKKPAGFTRSFEGALVWGGQRLPGRWIGAEERRQGQRPS